MCGQSVEESVLQVEECVGPEVEATDTACVKKAEANAQQIKRAYRLSKHVQSLSLISPRLTARYSRNFTYRITEALL
jgi:hypothetical protein